MTLWMVWASAVTLLLGLASLAGEQMLRSLGRPGRWVWVAAIGFSLGLQLWSWAAPPEPVAIPTRVVVAEVATPPAAVAEWESSFLALSTVVEALRGRAAELDGAARVVWITGALVLLGSLLGGVVSLRLRMRGWKPVRVVGEPVLMSPDFGPALVGVIKPWIVVPRWVLGLDPARLRVTFLHESEHRAARDTLLLMATSMSLIVNPWNPAMWWCARRLRQAIELDCDGRVLARGVSPESYGTLLIDLSAASPPISLPVAALSNEARLLERRLKMMNVMERVSTLRIVGSIAAVTALTLVACQTPAPSAVDAELEQATASSASFTAPELRGALGEGYPLVFIDGERVDDDSGVSLDELDPSTIERVEIIKGEAAVELFGEEASSGVVQITTKSALEVADEASGENALVTSGGVVRRAEIEAQWRRQQEHSEDDSGAERTWRLRQRASTEGWAVRERQSSDPIDASIGKATFTAEEDRLPLRAASEMEAMASTIYIDGVRVDRSSGISLRDLDPTMIDRIEVDRSKGEPAVYVYTKGS